MISFVGEIKSILLWSKGEYKVLKILAHSSKLLSLQTAILYFFLLQVSIPINYIFIFCEIEFFFRISDHNIALT